jgi:hypothetical protein
VRRRCTPIRKSMRASLGSAVLRSAMLLCHSVAQASLRRGSTSRSVDVWHRNFRREFPEMRRRLGTVPVIVKLVITVRIEGTPLSILKRKGLLEWSPEACVLQFEDGIERNIVATARFRYDNPCVWDAPAGPGGIPFHGSTHDDPAGLLYRSSGDPTAPAPTRSAFSSRSAPSSGSSARATSSALPKVDDFIGWRCRPPILSF